MSEYIEARNVAVEIIDRLSAIHAEYKCRAMSVLPPGEGRAKPEDIATWQKNRQADCMAIIRRHEMELREGVSELGTNPRLQAVISAEVPLFQAVNVLANFWLWLQANNLVVAENERDPKMAQTIFPPAPVEELTGVTVLTYMRALRTWLGVVSDELWGEDNPLELPPLGDRFLLGDFNHSQAVMDILGEGQALHHHWSNIAACGAYWDAIGVGAARARLIYKALSLLESLLHPPT